MGAQPWGGPEGEEALARKPLAARTQLARATFETIPMAGSTGVGDHPTATSASGTRLTERKETLVVVENTASGTSLTCAWRRPGSGAAAVTGRAWCIRCEVHRSFDAGDCLLEAQMKMGFQIVAIGRRHSRSPGSPGPAAPE